MIMEISEHYFYQWRKSKAENKGVWWYEIQCVMGT